MCKCTSQLLISQLHNMSCCLGLKQVIYRKDDWWKWLRNGKEWHWINMNKRNTELSTLGKVNSGPCNHSKSGWGADRAAPSVEESTNPEEKNSSLTNYTERVRRAAARLYSHQWNAAMFTQCLAELNYANLREWFMEKRMDHKKMTSETGFQPLSQLTCVLWREPCLQNVAPDIKHPTIQWERTPDENHPNCQLHWDQRWWSDKGSDRASCADQRSVPASVRVPSCFITRARTSLQLACADVMQSDQRSMTFEIITWEENMNCYVKNERQWRVWVLQVSMFLWMIHFWLSHTRLQMCDCDTKVESSDLTIICSVLITQMTQAEHWNMKTSSGSSAKTASPLPSTAAAVAEAEIHTQPWLLQHGPYELSAWLHSLAPMIKCLIKCCCSLKLSKGTDVT